MYTIMFTFLKADSLSEVGLNGKNSASIFKFFYVIYVIAIKLFTNTVAYLFFVKF
jgi:hypothetical protein